MTDKKTKINQAALERAIKKMTPFLTALEKQDWKKAHKEINKMSKSLNPSYKTHIYNELTGKWRKQKSKSLKNK